MGVKEKEDLPAHYYINPMGCVDFKEVCQILKMGRRAIIELMKANAFPAPFVNSEGGCHKRKKKRWVYQDIIDWVRLRQKGVAPRYKNNVIRVPFTKYNEYVKEVREGNKMLLRTNAKDIRNG